MKKTLTLTLFIALSVGVLSLPNVYATGFGTNITITDLMGSGLGWYGAQEDNEVEPGGVIGHNWDLEAFFLDGLNLTMVGTTDFQNGIYYNKNDRTYLSGDIFVDVNGDLTYEPPNSSFSRYKNIVRNTAGYDYVFHINYSDLSYDLFAIDGNASLASILRYSDVNKEFNPWVYHSGGTFITSGNVTYQTGLLDSQVGGLSGGGYTHNALTVDLSPIGSSLLHNPVTFYNTYDSGNDILMGVKPMAVNPEPSTLLLFGSGLLGFGVFNRLRRNRKKT